MSGFTFEEITKTKPEKSLIKTVKKNAGRNAQGRITVRHRGGGSKRRVRMIESRDFDRMHYPHTIYQRLRRLARKTYLHVKANLSS